MTAAPAVEWTSLLTRISIWCSFVSMKPSALFLLSCLACLLCGCSFVQRHFFPDSTQENRSERKKELPPSYLGTVHQVYPSRHFALLRIIAPVALRPGVTLITHPVDGSTSRIGNLVISEQSQPNRHIFVADIRSGSVESGDCVYLYRNISQQPDSKEQRSPLVDSDTPAVAPPSSNSVWEQAPRPSAPVDAVSPQAEGSPAPLSQPQSSSAPADGVEVTTPPSSVPQGAPSQWITPPSAPEQAPAYLDDIPQSIDQWD